MSDPTANGDDTRPTPEDLARDLRADLTLCDQATEGPWTAWHSDEHAVGIADFDTTEATATGSFVFRQAGGAIHVVPPGGIVPDNGTYIASARAINCGYYIDTGDPVGEELVPLRPTDAAMIAASRDGWPAAIRRALAAEADNARLRSALVAAEQYIGDEDDSGRSTRRSLAILAEIRATLGREGGAA